MGNSQFHDSPNNQQFKEIRAIVAFSGQTDFRWLKCLRPGFRHCFVWIECPSVTDNVNEGSWVLCNPLSHYTQVTVWPLQGEHILRTWLANEGLFLVETIVQQPKCMALPWRPFTCVEVVKRVLGLQASMVFTPWQLYKYIKNENKMKKFLDIPNLLGY